MLTVAIVVIQIQLTKSFLNCNFEPLGCLLFLYLNLEVSFPFCILNRLFWVGFFLFFFLPQDSMMNLMKQSDKQEFQ